MSSEFATAYELALKKIRTKDRFVQEVRAELDDFESEVVEQIVARLIEKGILNDERLLIRTIQSNIGKSAVAGAHLRTQMEARGAETDLLATFEWSDGDSQRIDDVLQGHFRHNPKDRGKAGRMLFRRGFDEEMIESALSRYFDSDQFD